MAPECFGRKAQIIQKSDVWAYGVLIYEVFNKGGMPWPGDKAFKSMAKRIRHGKHLFFLLTLCFILFFYRRNASITRYYTCNN
jgi:serine/threonine protein kinase